MSLGRALMVAPNDERFDKNGNYILIKPHDLDLDSQGQEVLCSRRNSEGIAICRQYQPLVMFVGGAKDPEYKPVLEGVFHPYNNAHEDIQDIGYASWQTSKQIKSLALHWIGQGQKVVLVGHSYGGDTVMDVARELSNDKKEIELVVTLDPVSNFGPREKQLKPSGVQKWLNVYVDYRKAKTSFGSANYIAKLGGPWGECIHADKNKIFLNGSGNDHAFANNMFAFYYKDVKAIS